MKSHFLKEGVSKYSEKRGFEKLKDRTYAPVYLPLCKNFSNFRRSGGEFFLDKESNHYIFNLYCLVRQQDLL